MADELTTTRDRVRGHLSVGYFGLALLVGVVLSLLAVMLAWPTWFEHRQTPEPPGLVMQIELREVVSPFDVFEIMAIDRDGPAIAILDDGTVQFPPELIVLRFPSAEVLERVERPSEAQIQYVRAQRWPGSVMAFDLDGDGVGDEYETHRNVDNSLAIVRSGVDQRMLWSYPDCLEYESDDRLTPLGDLDRDGYAELAIFHPRMDRSTYDFEIPDRLFGAKSWLSIISGARATSGRDHR